MMRWWFERRGSRCVRGLLFGFCVMGSCRTFDEYTPGAFADGNGETGGAGAPDGSSSGRAGLGGSDGGDAGTARADGGVGGSRPDTVAGMTGVAGDEGVIGDGGRAAASGAAGGTGEPPADDGGSAGEATRDTGDGGVGGSADGGSGDGGSAVAPPRQPGLSGVVALYVRGEFRCGGTLLTNAWVLTADQCVPGDVAPRDITIGFGADRAALAQVERAVEIQRFPGNDGSPAARSRDLVLVGAEEPFVIDGRDHGYHHATVPWASDYSDLTHRCVGWDLRVDAASPTTRLHERALVPRHIELGMPSGSRAGDIVTWLNTNLLDRDAGILPMSADVGTGCFITILEDEYLTVVQSGSPVLRLDGSVNDRHEATGVSLGDREIRNFLDRALIGVSEIPGAFAGPVTTCSLDEDSFELFGLSAAGTMQHRRFEREGDQVSDRGELAPPPGLALHSSLPGALCAPDGSIELFARAEDDRVYWQHRTPGGTWFETWERVPQASTRITSGVAVVGVVPGHFHLFARGPDNELRHAEFDGEWLEMWENLGGSLASTPAARMKDQEGRIDVFASFNDGSLQANPFKLRRWNGWVSFGGGSTSSPAMSAWSSERADLFGRNANGHLWHLWYSSGWVSTYVDPEIPMPEGDPSAISTRKGSIDLIVAKADGNLWHAHFPRAPRAP